LIDAGGQIMLGKMAPVNGVAVAHDGKKTLAMLKRQNQESVADLLTRLDSAIGRATATGVRVDEINATASSASYEVANPELRGNVNAVRK
jgi:hypothetical protein